MKPLAILIFVLILDSLAHAARQPNIVLIISDDQSWTDYGFMGHEIIQTPHLDKLAAESATFTRGYVPTALCRPSLMTLVTGLYASQHGVTGNDPKLRTPQLRSALIAKIDQHPTLPKLLGERTYLSHQSGKWWEGHYSRGGFTHGMTRGFPQKGGRHGDDGLKIGREGMKPVFDFINHAVNEDKPFFIWYAPFMPHTPHRPPERLLKKYTVQGRSPFEAKYYAMCDWFDETCGELTSYLDQKKLRENTLIVYVTDNGWIQHPSRNGYGPRSKQTPYEGGTRTPIMFNWPGTIKPGNYADLISSIDLVPTMLSAAGAKIPQTLPGLDLMPVLRDGEKLARNIVFGEGCAHDILDLDNHEATLLYRWCIEGKWKLLLTYDGKVSRYQSTHPRTEKRPQLFDLLADPHETTNLAGDHPERVEQLVKKIDEWYPVKTAKTVRVFE
ncbi:MAG: sulfatase [Verrucomicrobiota bacterium]|jgi:uncharacterized sulfatase